VSTTTCPKCHSDRLLGPSAFDRLAPHRCLECGTEVSVTQADTATYQRREMAQQNKAHPRPDRIRSCQRSRWAEVQDLSVPIETS
jgi:hypothetical protein